MSDVHGYAKKFETRLDFSFYTNFVYLAEVIEERLDF